MINKIKILEAENNMRNYLKEGLIRKKDFDVNIFRIFVNNAKESLFVANVLYRNKFSYLWTIVCSYYSMYYIPNAVLFKLGYKIGDKISHKICFDALVVFVRGKLKKSLLEQYENVKEESLKIAGINADDFIESFEFERVKRGSLQYQTTEKIKQSKAKTSLDRSKKFVFEMEKLLR
jgi:uncharacterized protein (UPF0332 family)